jgi:hypothetical protein
MNVSNEGAEGQMSPEDMTPEQFMSALFANMVIQNSNMALMFLGKVPHPQTGQPVKDLESAQMFIDQLEMLAYKTRGNLDNEEKQLLQQSLISLRMAFVEELRKAGIPVPDHLTQQSEPAMPAPTSASPAPKPQANVPEAAAPQAAPTSQAQPPQTPAQPSTPPPSREEEESRKRFSKKY